MSNTIINIKDINVRMKPKHKTDKSNYKNSIVDTLLAELFELKTDEMGLDLNEMIYQGFQPKEFLRLIQQKAKAAGVKDNEMKQHLVFLGMMCAIRGSKIIKLANSNGTSDWAKNKLSNLIRIYDIKEGRPSGPTAATLPRFLAVTTIPVSKAINQDRGEKIKLPISPEEVAEGFPLIFCMSHAGGLLPSGVNYPTFWYKAVAYEQYIMSLKFGSQPRKTQVLQFVQVASRSNLWTDEQKIGHLNSLGLMLGGDFIDEVRTALTEASNKFDALPF